MTNPEVSSVNHNSAYDSAITKPFAIVMETLAQPLITHIYQPLNEYNHNLAVVAANATLTAPRALEPLLGNVYIDAYRDERYGLAAVAATGKMALKFLDGLDGPVLRAIDGATLFGAGFDPFVDMIGTKDDGRCIKAVAEAEGDRTTAALVDARLATDVLAIATGGVLDTAVTKFLEQKGMVLDRKDQPKANFVAKGKFFAGAVANAAHLYGALMRSPEQRKKTKQVANGLLGISIAAGVVAGALYIKNSIRKYKLLKELDDPETGE